MLPKTTKNNIFMEEFMKFTWRHVIELAINMFEIKQIEIAECLNVDRSVISRLLNGEQKSTRIGITTIYQKIFDPNQKNSPAAIFQNKTHTKNLLDYLKECIKSQNLEANLLQSIKYTDYESLVMGLLHTAKNNEPKPSKSKSVGTNQVPQNFQENKPLSHIACPENYKLCMCCQNWRGNLSETLKSTAELQAQCKLDNSIKWSSNTCNNFNPNYNSITFMKITKK